jgi:propionyl-CoA carboxylase alpha chain
MLAKLIAWAPSRAEAARRLAAALAGARLHGITTNRDLLVRVLRHPAFRAGDVDTGFLDREGAALAEAIDEMPEFLRRAVCSLQSSVGSLQSAVFQSADCDCSLRLKTEHCDRLRLPTAD